MGRKLQYFEIIIVLIPVVLSLPEYPDRIPNGHRIPHPCFTNTIWKGAGHRYHSGGGTLNPFGIDFQRNGHTWDRCLCEQDSDGDGRTNGEELGDPNCVWTPGNFPENLEGLSHPGVCEPLDSTACITANNWDICAPVEFQCEGLDAEHVTTREVRFNPTEVPSGETSYFCLAVEFSMDEDLHLIAMTPYVDNEFVVHHIEMYDCVTDEEKSHILGNYRNASNCMGMSGCNKMLAAWSLGISGICLVPEAGVRVGLYGAQVAVMKIHYHNPTHRVGEIDTSGMVFYQTDVLRKYDAGVFNFGQYYIEIPPGQAHHEEVINCGPFCTNTFTEDIHLIFGAIHMHYLGKSGSAALYEGDTKIGDIMIQDHYDYLAPHIQNFAPSVKVSPGQTIRHVCEFQSLERTDMTWWGGGALDEMCNIYFAYYPVQNLTNCDNRGSTMHCRYNVKYREDEYNYEEQECDVNDFDNVWNSYMGDSLKAVCDTTRSECKPGCPEALSWAYSNHSCLSGEARTGMFYRKWELRNMHVSCEEYPESVNPDTTPAGNVALDCPFANEAEILNSWISVLLIGVLLSFL